MTLKPHESNAVGAKIGPYLHRQAVLPLQFFPIAPVRKRPVRTSGPILPRHTGLWNAPPWHTGLRLLPNRAAET